MPPAAEFVRAGESVGVIRLVVPIADFHHAENALAVTQLRVQAMPVDRVITGRRVEGVTIKDSDLAIPRLAWFPEQPQAKRGNVERRAGVDRVHRNELRPAEG